MARRHSSRSVTVAAAQRELAPMLDKYTKVEVARHSGLCIKTLKNIDYGVVARVDRSTVAALRSARGKLS